MPSDLLLATAASDLVDTAAGAPVRTREWMVDGAIWPTESVGLLRPFPWGAGRQRAQESSRQDFSWISDLAEEIVSYIGMLQWQIVRGGHEVADGHPTSTNRDRVPARLDRIGRLAGDEAAGQVRDRLVHPRIGQRLDDLVRLDQAAHVRIVEEGEHDHPRETVGCAVVVAEGIPRLERELG